MLAIKLAEKINNEIRDRQTSTTTILRDARTLGKLLKTREFEWVEKELKGYKAGEDGVPTYRITNAIESKKWIVHLNTDLQNLYSDWLKERRWVKWLLTQPVPELEDLLKTGYVKNTGTVLKSLGLSKYKQTPIYLLITVSGQEIKNILDLIQDKIQSQVAEILATPKMSESAIGIFLIYSDKLPESKDDFDKITVFLETGQDYLSAARTCRPILHSLINTLVKSAVPKDYKFTDGKTLQSGGEKSKFKYYLENKGESLFRDKKKILFLDNIFRDLYDVSSKAIKNKVNIYEANYCVDKFKEFLEQLYRYTDLKPI